MASKQSINHPTPSIVKLSKSNTTSIQLSFELLLNINNAKYHQIINYSRGNKLVAIQQIYFNKFHLLVFFENIINFFHFIANQNGVQMM